jgi:hypothetical protein
MTTRDFGRRVAARLGRFRLHGPLPLAGSGIERVEVWIERVPSAATLAELLAD